MSLHYLPRPDDLLHNASGRRRLVELARCFPSLEHAILANKHGEFDPRVFSRWATRHLYCESARHAARFILMVFNDSVRWKIGRFDLMSAVRCWDAAHRKAFLEWAKDPWNP